MRRTKYTVKYTTGFKKDYKRAIKRGLKIELLEQVVTLLAMGETLPEKNRDHDLSGDWVATSFGCPFEGKYEDPARLTEFLKDYAEAGMKTCCLCDTIGIADPAQVKAVGHRECAYPGLDSWCLP